MSSSSHPSHPSSSSPELSGWTLYEKNPVLGAEFGVIFDLSLLPPTTTHPTYRMYNSWKLGAKGEAIDAIGYSESQDGLTWTGQRVVLPPVSGGWEAAVNRPSVVCSEGAAAYEMWYTGQSATQSAIGHAESPDGLHWTRTSASPVLTADSATWEKVAVMCPSVIHTAGPTSDDSRLRMYYSGGEQEEPDSIGVAFSSDGRTWQKCPLNPIFSCNPEAEWERAKVTAAHVFYDPIDSLYYMFYIGFADVDTASINLARSKDGLTEWTRHPANPIIARAASDSSSWMRDAVYKPYALYDEANERWLLWFNARRGDIEAIGVAIRKGHNLGFDSPIKRTAEH